MRQTLLSVIAKAGIGLGLMAAIGGGAVFAAAADQDALQADHAFMVALAAADKNTVAPLLDAELMWVSTDGKTVDRAQVLENLPASTISDAGSKSYVYDQMVTVRTDAGKLHVLRVWAKRPAGWRLVSYHEVKQLEQAAAGPPAPLVKECINPCKTVPYQPKNEAEAGVFKSWQALETAVTAGDAQAWAPHFADEFVVFRSRETEPETKAERIANLISQKQAGTNRAPGQLAPDHTRMVTIGDSVVMRCRTLAHRGKPTQVTRVWTKRGAMWLMTVSFQTTIEAAAAVGE